MTKNEIRNYLITRISDTLTEAIEDKSIEERITEDHINDFLWNHDFGMDIVDQYLDDHEDEMIEAYLESIYMDIDADDLESPF